MKTLVEICETERTVSVIVGGHKMCEMCLGPDDGQPQYCPRLNGKAALIEEWFAHWVLYAIQEPLPSTKTIKAVVKAIRKWQDCGDCGMCD